MLSDTDVHYLVGLLTRAEEAQDVAVELGDMVFDASANKRRDVDITAIYIDESGRRTVYRGIEVKNHITRPLTVEHVEQLCIKLADMPDITHKGIVSASGYTNGAVNKARAHNVELLEIVDWKDPGEGFNVKFNPNVLRIVEPIWTRGPQVIIDVMSDDAKGENLAFGENPQVCDESGMAIPNVPNAEALTEAVHRNVSSDLAKSNDQSMVNDGDTVSIDKTVLFRDKHCLKVNQKIIPISKCQVEGEITYKIHAQPLFKVLRKYGEDEPISGCAIVETGDKSLIGLTVNNLTKQITYLNIPIADRERKKIRRYKLSFDRVKSERNAS